MHNFLDKMEVRMGAVKAHTGKELVEQAELAEKSAKKFEPLVPKNRWGVNNKGRNASQSSQVKGKDIGCGTVGEAPPKPKRSNSNDNPEFKLPQKQYSFKDKQVVTIFHLLNKGDKLKLPEV